MRLDNPLLVRWEFASEERLNKRNAIFRSLVEGDSPEDLAIAAVEAVRPSRLLDVGCGPGELTEQLARDLGADVRAIDISPRMVELARNRGIDAQIADVGATVNAWLHGKAPSRGVPGQPILTP